MAQFVFRLVDTARPGTLDPTAANPFSDVGDEGEFVDAISALADGQVVDGFGDDTYRPALSVTRGEMAKFIHNAIEVTQGASLVDSENADDTPNGNDDADAFDDDDGSIFEPFIDALAAEGIVEGDGAGLYDPNGTVDRGQMAVFVMRAAAYLDSVNRFAPTASAEVDPALEGLTATDRDGDGVLSEDPLPDDATAATFECLDDDCTQVRVTVAGPVTVIGDGELSSEVQLVAASGIVDAATGVEFDPEPDNPDNQAVIEEENPASSPPSDTQAPQLTQSTPEDGAVGVAPEVSPSATFDEALAASSTASVRCDGADVDGTTEVSGNTITFQPSDPDGLPYANECAATFDVADGSSNAATVSVTFSTLPTDTVQTGSDADDVTVTESPSYYRVQTEDPNGNPFDVQHATTVLWVEDGRVYDQTDSGAEALYLRRPDAAYHEVTTYYELDGTWLHLTATYDEHGDLATINGDPYPPEAVDSDPAVSASGADDVTVITDPDYYRVQTRDAAGDTFDVREALTVLWVEDGQVHDLTDPDGAEALYLRRPDSPDQRIAVYYELSEGQWVEIVAEYDGNGDLARINGEEYTGPHA